MSSARNDPVRGGGWLRLVAGFACAAGILSVRPALAIDPDRALSQFVRDQWSTEQGFPQGPVYAINQTADGYLWIGTEAGLVRFDGWNFQLVKDESGSFAITSVLGLASDNEGCLWLRLADLTVVRYCRGVFENPLSGPNPYANVSALGRDNRGELLLAKAEEGAFGFHGGRLRLLASATDLPRSPVISLAQTGNGDVWMGTRDAGLFRLGAPQSLSVRKELPDTKVNCLLADGPKGLWIGTDNGIVRWDGNRLIPAGLPASLNHFQALAMVRDRDGNIWVGTDSSGLLRFNAHGVASLHETDGVSREAVTAVFEDREGNLWIGSARGLERLRDSAFITYSVPEGLPTDGSNPVFVDADQRMWFSPVTGGLWWMIDGKHGRVLKDGLNQDVVYAITGGSGDLWLGRQNGGLTRLRSEGGAWAAQNFTRANGLAQDSVYSVYMARDGTVWAGTLSGGVSKFSQGRFTTYTVAEGLSANTVAAVLESSDGTMWFATPAGLTSLQAGRWRSYTTRDGLPSENVNCLLEDSKGVLWVGTVAGLAFRGPNGFQSPRETPEALHEIVLGLAEDRYGSLWIATSNHVLRVNRQNLLRGSLAEGDVREFGFADGLRGMEGVKRNRSVVVDPAGRIWISLNRGISVVDPARVTRNSAPAIAHVQSILADGSPLRLSTAVHIPAGRRRVTLTFAGLGLSGPERVRYRYRLDGFDRDWSDSSLDREAVYTNLSPRSYRFRVMASNPDGGWSPYEASVTFEVDPLFWQTGGFFVSVVLACGLAVLGIHQFHLRRLARQLNLRFEERLTERTRIAQELHDTLLQGFISASMQVHVAADLLPPDSREKPILTRALELMRQVIDEGRNAVRGLRSSQSASLDLEQAFAQIQQEFPAGQDRPEFRVIVDGERRPLHPILRDEVYRIGREALLNSFRHSHARKIEIELKYSARMLQVLVRDDGCGIDPAILKSGRDGHWGLSGMQERADRIRGTLHVWTSPAAGTEIELSIPSEVAFQTKKRQSRNGQTPANPDGSRP